MQYIQLKEHFNVFAGVFLLAVLLSSCKAVVPELPEMQAQQPVNTKYSTALADLNTVLEVYLPPDYPTTYYYVKPITDATGLSQTGEIPLDITSLVRDAISQVYYKVRYVEQYDQSDIIQMQAEIIKLQTSKLQGVQVKPAQRPAVDFTIAGRISQFDRNLESESDKARAMANVGQGLSRTDGAASAEVSSRLSRLSISLSVFNPSGVALPGKYGASMELMYAKNGFDIGFAIFGNGLGFGSEATAMHGRHLALQMMTELSMVQIIGRSLNVPYWRVGEMHKIFTLDRLVINDWRNQYASMGPLLIPYMQAACIACGDSSVLVTGQLDAQTQAAFDRFARKFNVRNRMYPNFELFVALESNRLLDTSVSSRAWAAYQAYKGGARPSAANHAPVQPRPVKKSPAAAPRQDVPTEEPDFSEPLGDLL